MEHNYVLSNYPDARQKPKSTTDRTIDSEFVANAIRAFHENFPEAPLTNPDQEGITSFISKTSVPVVILK